MTSLLKLSNKKCQLQQCVRANDSLPTENILANGVTKHTKNVTYETQPLVSEKNSSGQPNHLTANADDNVPLHASGNALYTVCDDTIAFIVSYTALLHSLQYSTTAIQLDSKSLYTWMYNFVCIQNTNRLAHVQIQN